MANVLPSGEIRRDRMAKQAAMPAMKRVQPGYLQHQIMNCRAKVLSRRSSRLWHMILAACNRRPATLRVSLATLHWSGIALGKPLDIDLGVFGFGFCLSRSFVGPRNQVRKQLARRPIGPCISLFQVWCRLEKHLLQFGVNLCQSPFEHTQAKTAKPICPVDQVIVRASQTSVGVKIAAQPMVIRRWQEQFDALALFPREEDWRENAFRFSQRRGQQNSSMSEPAARVQRFLGWHLSKTFCTWAMLTCVYLCVVLTLTCPNIF